ncbi:hypothetical protein [Acinetobacter towneri]
MKLSNLKNEPIVSTQEDTPICIMHHQTVSALTGLYVSSMGA